MRRVAWVLMLCILAGCSSVILPNYITDRHPYKRRLDSSFEQTVSATKEALKDMGWGIKEEKDPGIYERSWRLNDPSIKHVLIFTEYSKSNYFVHSKNTVINAYVREIAGGSCDVELRYLSVSTYSFKKFFDYRNDHLINQIYKSIEEKLQASEKKLVPSH